MNEWSLVDAIYGPEGYETNIFEHPKWYAKLLAMTNDGDHTIYFKGFVIGKKQFPQEYNNYLASTLTGSTTALKEVYAILIRKEGN